MQSQNALTFKTIETGKRSMVDVRIEQAARLAGEWTKLGSVEVVTKCENTLDRPLPGLVEPAKWIFYHYIETPNRQRYLEMTMRSQDDRVMMHNLSFSDGKRFADYEHKRGEPDVPEVIVHGRSFDGEADAGGSACPEPLKFYYIDKTPLHEALPTATYLDSDVAGATPVHRFLFQDVPYGKFRQSIVVHLAEDEILPQKFLVYRTEEARQQQRPGWMWTATSVQPIQGKQFPTKSQIIRYDPTNNAIERSATTITVTKALFGQTYPASTFWRPDDPRATVFDGINGKITAPKVALKQATVVANPIHVDPVVDHSSSLMLSSVAVGLAAIATAGFLWMRRS